MDISWFEFLLFSLATFRITRLIVYDQITEWIRKPFFIEVSELDDEGNNEIYLVPVEKGIKYWIGSLLSCYWCTGIWTAFGLFLLHNQFPSVCSAVIFIFAAAGLASMIETLIQSIISE